MGIKKEECMGGTPQSNPECGAQKNPRTHQSLVLDFHATQEKHTIFALSLEEKI